MVGEPQRVEHPTLGGSLKQRWGTSVAGACRPSMTLLSHSEFPARVSCEVGLEEGRSFRNSHVEVREVLDLRTQSIRLTVEKMTASAPVNSEGNAATG